MNNLYARTKKVYQKGSQIKDLVAALDMRIIRDKSKDVLTPLEKALNVTVL
jgi:hypothetical protein